METSTKFVEITIGEYDDRVTLAFLQVPAAMNLYKMEQTFNTLQPRCTPRDLGWCAYRISPRDTRNLPWVDVEPADYDFGTWVNGLVEKLADDPELDNPERISFIDWLVYKQGCVNIPYDSFSVS